MAPKVSGTLKRKPARNGKGGNPDFQYLQPEDQLLLEDKCCNYKKRSATTIDENFLSMFPEIQHVAHANLSLKDIRFGKRLGNGTFGACYKAQVLQSDKFFAIKVIDTKRIAELGMLHHLDREIQIQKSVMHRNILQLYNWFKNGANVYLMLELAPGGELYNLIQTLGRFSDVRASLYMNQTLDAITYLHEQGILHRDIKPENILLGQNNVLKIADFGAAVDAGAGNKRRTFCGTLDYQAPEMLKGAPYDKHADIWSLGVLMYEFLVGTAPFADDDEDETQMRIKTEPIRFPIILTTTGKATQLSNGAKELIKNFLEKDPAKRISLEKVRICPWMLLAFQNQLWCDKYYARDLSITQPEESSSSTCCDSAEKRRRFVFSDLQSCHR